MVSKGKAIIKRARCGGRVLGTQEHASCAQEAVQVAGKDLYKLGDEYMYIKFYLITRRHFEFPIYCSVSPN